MNSNWSKTKVGSLLMEVEKDALSAAIPNLYGHYLLECSAFNQSIIENTSLNHHFFASNRKNRQLVIDYEALPFRENSLDCVVSHHVLDLESEAHQCLRESSRVVVPNGYLVIVGFNPWSAWGVSRLFPRYGLAPRGRYISKRRLIDWLALLGFRVEYVGGTQYCPPIILRHFPRFSGYVDKCLSYLGVGGAGVYIVLARKLVAGRTPIRPQWRALSGRRIPVATPSTRGVSVTSR